MGAVPRWFLRRTRLPLPLYVLEHRAAHHVANGVDGARPRMWASTSTRPRSSVESPASRFNPSVYGRRPTPTKQYSALKVTSSPLALSAFTVTLACGCDFFHPVLEVEFGPELLHGAHEFLAHGAVHRDDAVGVFHHVHFGAEARVDGLELKADHAAADDDHGLGNSGKLPLPCW